MKTLSELRFNNTYAGLPETFFHRVNPEPLGNARLVHANPDAAGLIGIEPDALNDTDAVACLGGERLLQGMQPLAQCYAGHQFGHYVPRLGDGRAVLLGEVESATGKWDLQIKGSGLTRYSRDGDGRAVLRSTIREYLCSEAMHHLRIATTRALCIIGSDEEVYRERIEPGAMLLRMAPSHVRFGTFEYFYYMDRHDDVRVLADYVLAHSYPHLLDEPQPYRALLGEVIRRTAGLIAQWQSVGFAHGVMNTDNMSIVGLTLDYGPFGFMEAYDPGFICNHSDHHGRYAFDQQPRIGLFNLSCLAQAMLPLLADSPEEAAEFARAALDEYEYAFSRVYTSLMLQKLGLDTDAGTDTETDYRLVTDLLRLMHRDRVDYTILFRSLCHFSTAGDNTLRDLFMDRHAFDQWAKHYILRLKSGPEEEGIRRARMLQVNPKYVLRNYMAETAIRKAEDEHDYSEIDRLLRLLQKPFDEQPENESYAGFPPEWAQQLAVSCSS